MPVSVHWFDKEQTVIRYEFENGWSWDELQLVLDEVNTMIDSVDHRVDVIVDLSASRFVPSSALLKIRAGTQQAAPNWGLGVFVQAGVFVNTLLETFRRLNQDLASRYATAESIDEALEIIAAQRSRDGIGDHNS